MGGSANNGEVKKCVRSCGIHCPDFRGFRHLQKTVHMTYEEKQNKLLVLKKGRVPTQLLDLKEIEMNQEKKKQHYQAKKDR